MQPINFSNRESQVIDCLLRGLDIRQTAAELGIGLNGVKFHRTRIYKRLGVRSDVGLVLHLWAAGYSRPGATLRVLEGTLPGGLNAPTN